VRWDPSGRWAETLTVAKHEHLRALIAANPERTWNLQTAAAALGASSRTLQRRLRTDGTTFGQTVVAGRLDAAAALLLRTSLDVTTIALACGFTDVSHLSSHFSRRFGEPPGRHRTRVRGHA
jgi:transcriptional regulator GlxA family with amidase domain